jgi:ribosome-binding protein aMBF1 (putative translation factor)
VYACSDYGSKRNFIYMCPLRKSERGMKALRSREHRQLCTALAEARAQAGLTQRELASRLKRPHSYVAKIEGGERRIDVIEFIELARALRIEPLKLFALVLSE